MVSYPSYAGGCPFAYFLGIDGAHALAGCSRLPVFSQSGNQKHSMVPYCLEGDALQFGDSGMISQYLLVLGYKLLARVRISTGIVW